MNTLKGLENLEEIMPRADIATAFELAEDPYGSWVLQKYAESRDTGVPINHHVKDWRREVINHFTDLLKHQDPFISYPEETAKAGFIIGFLMAYTEQRAGA